MIRKLLQDQKGSAEAISFLVGSLLLLFILVQFIEIVHIEIDNTFITIAYKKGLDEMQIQGGLTPHIETEIKDYLQNYGLDRSKITVSGTIAPVDWGDDIYLEISYEKEYYKFSLQRLTDPDRQTKYMILNKEGSTASYYFDNNS